MSSEISEDGLPWNRSNYKPLIINVALTGAVPRKEEHPNLPQTPEEIAEDVQRCSAAGAQVFHLHMRTEKGEPTQDPELFERTIELVRKNTPEAIVCATTTARGSRNFGDRVSALQLPDHLLPELASLSLGSFNFPATISSNPPEEIIQLAEIMKDKGIKPELEVFEPGMLSFALHLVKKEILQNPLVVNILLGNKGTSTATNLALSGFLAQMPAQSEWALAGIGRFQQKATALGISLGGNVRVGMEDDPAGSEGKSWSNLKAVKFAVNLATLVGRTLETPDLVRERFGIGLREANNSD